MWMRFKDTDVLEKFPEVQFAYVDVQQLKLTFNNDMQSCTVYDGKIKLKLMSCSYVGGHELYSRVSWISCAAVM